MPRQKAYEVIRELVRIAHHERNNRIAARWAGELVTDELKRLRSVHELVGLDLSVGG